MNDYFLFLSLSYQIKSIKFGFISCFIVIISVDIIDVMNIIFTK
jgi:hypothetical protein